MRRSNKGISSKDGAYFRSMQSTSTHVRTHARTHTQCVFLPVFKKELLALFLVYVVYTC